MTDTKLSDLWKQKYYEKVAELNAKIVELADKNDVLESEAGMDCYQYDKYLNPNACGGCLSCEARNVLAKYTLIV